MWARADLCVPLVQSRRLPLRDEADIIAARRAAKELAVALGFDLLAQVHVATAVSELARNALAYAGGGQLTLEPVRDGERHGLELVCRDEGPGIGDLPLALVGSHSTGRGLGRGLSAARKLLDEFGVDTAPGRGTTVRARKWLT